jgi:hypothetical protein
MSIIAVAILNFIPAAALVAALAWVMAVPLRGRAEARARPVALPQRERPARRAA